MVRLNDSFFALFVTIVNVVLSFVFVFVAYFLGFHNEEPDYHICTGQKPSVNIANTMKKMKHPSPMNVISPTEWLKVRLHIPFTLSKRDYLFGELILMLAGRKVKFRKAIACVNGM